MQTEKSFHLQKDWEYTPSFFVRKKKLWNNNATRNREVKGVKDREEGTEKTKAGRKKISLKIKISGSKKMV